MDLQKQNNEKFRLPIAITLAVLSIFIINYFFPPAKTSGRPAAPRDGSAPHAAKQKPDTEAVPEPPETKPATAVKNFTKQYITLQNNKTKVIISTENGVIVTNVLKSNYYNNLQLDIEQNHLPGYHTGRLSFQNRLQTRPAPQYYRLVSRTTNKIILQTTLRQEKYQYKLTKSYTLKNYQLKLKIQVQNNRNQLAPLHFYIINGSSIGVNRWTQSKRSAIEKVSYYDGEDLEDPLSPGFLDSGTNFFQTARNTKWIAYDNRFYCRYMEPQKHNLPCSFFKTTGQRPTNNIGAYKIQTDLPANALTEYSFTIYSLPKSRHLLNRLSEKGNDYFAIFDQSSVMKFLSDMMYNFLMFINRFIRNFGLSIILMTLLIKLITFPLNQKSYKSMAKMQQLQPKINAIKQNHKNNPKQAQVETMNLYKKEKINPLSGCFPMLIPIPLFIALYFVFLNMIELNGQSFLWIDDLTLPDTVYTLPFSIPFLGSGVKILPFLMVISSIFQSMFTPQSSGSGQQAKMMKYIFPAVFFFICWNLPSALVLFWTLNGLFSFLQTLLVKKKIKT